MRAVRRERHRVRPVRAVHVHGVAAHAVHDDLVTHLVTPHTNLGSQINDHEIAVRGDVEKIGGRRPGDADGIRLGIPDAAERGKVHVHLRHGRACQVIHRGGVGAAKGLEVELFDTVRVQDDVAQVAGEAQSLPVGGEVEDLVAVRSVECHDVVPGLALDRITSVTRVPSKNVVASAQQSRIVALVAVNEVVAGAADQNVGTVAAQQRVVTGPAVHRDLNQGGQVPRACECIVAAVGIEDEVFGGADVEEERGGVDAVEPHPGAVGGHREVFVPVTPIDLDGIDAVAALHEVGSVAGIPVELVVARTHVRGIVAGAAVKRFRAAAADQGIIVRLAVQRRDLGVRKDAVPLVDPDHVVSAAGVHEDLIKQGAVEAEVGRAVIPEVDLQHRRHPRLQSQGDQVGRLRTLHDQRAVLDVCGVRRLKVPEIVQPLLVVRQRDAAVAVIIRLRHKRRMALACPERRQENVVVACVHVAIPVQVAGHDRQRSHKLPAIHRGRRTAQPAGRIQIAGVSGHSAPHHRTNRRHVDRPRRLVPCNAPFVPRCAARHHRQHAHAPRQQNGTHPIHPLLPARCNL